jgi:small subunit ribosomal protein S1
VLTVWPDLSTDIEAVRASIGDFCEYVWENRAGEIQSVELSAVEAEGFPDDAIAAAVIPASLDEYKPLLQGVLPDADGVLRARWSPR